VKRAALLLLALALAACSKDAKSNPGTGKAEDAMVAAWKKAGLDVSAFTDVDGKKYAAQACRGGTVGGVDVVLCSYDTGEDAKAAEDPGLAGVGDATGAALAHGSRLLVVADRRKADPTGRSIDAITRAFMK
jgi:hypothetical protein